MMPALDDPLSVRNENSLPVIKPIDLKTKQNLPALEPFMKRRKMLVFEFRGCWHTLGLFLITLRSKYVSFAGTQLLFIWL